MYGEIGMCDKIPKKADIVARIKIERLYGIDGKTEIKPVLTLFEATLRSTKKTISNGKHLFEKGSIESAICKYKKCIEQLENFHFADEREEKEINAFLIKLYLNLCICYNKNNNPQKTCLAMRQLERLSPIKNNPKALYHKARALIMLDDFDKASKCLNQAMKIEPDNKSIICAMNDIKKLRKDKIEYKKILEQIQAEVLKENNSDNANECRISRDVLKFK